MLLREYDYFLHILRLCATDLSFNSCSYSCLLY
jgi:hypothetical protein